MTFQLQRMKGGCGQSQDSDDLGVVETISEESPAIRRGRNKAEEADMKP